MAYVPSFTPQAIAERKTWQFKVLSFCHDHPTWAETGFILVGVMGRFKKPPYWHPRGITISAAGEVIGLYKARADQPIRVARMFESVAELVERFRRLADEARLEDYERVAMFDELKKWVVEDKRAQSEI